MGDWKIPHIMQGKLLRQALDKFMKADVAQNARVQVVLPNGEFYDIKGIQLLKQVVGCKRNTQTCNHHRANTMAYG